MHWVIAATPLAMNYQAAVLLGKNSEATVVTVNFVRIGGRLDKPIVILFHRARPVLI
jgi:hypothetical protein